MNMSRDLRAAADSYDYLWPSASNERQKGMVNPAHLLRQGAQAIDEYTERVTGLENQIVHIAGLAGERIEACANIADEDNNSPLRAILAEHERGIWERLLIALGDQQGVGR